MTSLILDSSQQSLPLQQPADAGKPAQNKALFTAKISQFSNVLTIKETLLLWKKRAFEELHKAERTKDNEVRARKQIYDDSYSVINALQYSINHNLENRAEYDEVKQQIESQSSNPPKSQSMERAQKQLLSLLEGNLTRYTIYVAYDESHKIQGVASFYNEYCKLDLIATNPDNLSKTDRKVKGVGTAIIKHIVADMKKAKAEKELQVFPLDSARPFYKRIGFEPIVLEDSDENDSDAGDDDMVFPNEIVDAFLATHDKVATIVESEPEKLS